MNKHVKTIATVRERERERERELHFREHVGANTAITLIALIITIIVLLILAGVTLSMVMGESGIFGKANKAKGVTIEEEEKEKISLAINISKMKYPYEVSQEEMENELNSFGCKFEVFFDGEYYKLVSNDTGKEYIFNKEGSFKEKGKYYYESDYVITDGNVRINVGDSINYKNIINEDTIYISNKEKNGYDTQKISAKEITDWVVLGVNNRGELLITTKKSIEENPYYLKGEKGVENGIEELDRICEMYKNGTGAESARSIRIEDINKITKYNPLNTGNNKIFGKENLNEYGNEVTYYWNNSQFPYYESENNLKGNLKNNHSNFYIYNENANEFNVNIFKNEEKSKIGTIKSNFYSYYIDTLTENNKDKENIFKEQERVYNLINSGSYWIASKIIEPNEDGVYYGFRVYAAWMKLIAGGGIFSSYGDNNQGICYSVRPVVTISDNVNLIGDSENGWNIN